MKPAKCKACKQEYQKWTTTQKACSPKCAIELVQAARAKERRKDTRKRKQALKTLSDWLGETQVACNAYIRQRDANKPCISCGRYDHEILERLTGGKWDAGHFKTRGAHTDLRFHPMNIHKQCKSCNGGSGKYTKKNHTVSKQYKENLIKRIGQDMVDWLEGPHKIQRLTIDDAKEIKAYYKEQLKILKQGY